MRLKQRGTRPGDKKKLSGVQRKILATYDNLQFWVNDALIQGVRLKAKEVHYERGRDGLTIRFRKGAEVLGTCGTYQRYKDRAIPRLREMAKIEPAGKAKTRTGKFQTIVDDHLWNCRVTWTRTRPGEKLAIRYTSSKPWKGFEEWSRRRKR